MKNNFFTFGKLQFNYFEQNIITERRFELPLLKYFLELFKNDKNLMEIGAVSNQYFPTTHNIYDPTDPNAIHKFAEDLDYFGKTVVSISTIEHIGNAEYGLAATSPYRAISVLNMMLEAKNYLITWPIGFNTLLDYYARNVVTGLNNRNVITACRDENNDWEITKPRFFDFEYNRPFRYGNGVIIITNLEELIQ